MKQIPGQSQPTPDTQPMWNELLRIKSEYEQLLAENRQSDGQYAALSNAEESAKLNDAIGRLRQNITDRR